MTANKVIEVFEKLDINLDEPTKPRDLMSLVFMLGLSNMSKEDFDQFIKDCRKIWRKAHK